MQAFAVHVRGALVLNGAVLEDRDRRPRYMRSFETKVQCKNLSAVL